MAATFPIKYRYQTDKRQPKRLPELFFTVYCQYFNQKGQVLPEKFLVIFSGWTTKTSKNSQSTRRKKEKRKKVHENHKLTQIE
jgi:hypothetical protein